MKAARIHCLAATCPYLPPDAASLHIAAPWGATTAQLCFWLKLSMGMLFARPMLVLMDHHRCIGAAAPCLCTPASLRARSCKFLRYYCEWHSWPYN